MTNSERIKDKAKELGFELRGIVRAKPVPDYDLFRWWLDQDFAGTMNYLKRGEERRGNPEKILPGVQSVSCCGMNYYTGKEAGLISSYAWGEDYHRVLGERLESLENFIKESFPGIETKRYVDTGAILERSYAAQAGLGWIGKNTCLINNGVGSFFFIGEILTTLDFSDEEYDRPTLDQCGTCSKCLDACPTQAFVEPYVMDARRCISYLTIEYRGDFSEEQKKMVGEHVYGCDICQQVCPYNDRIQATSVKAFYPKQVWLESNEKFAVMNEEEFKEVTKDSAMDRIKFKQWRRNLAK